MRPLRLLAFLLLIAASAAASASRDAYILTLGGEQTAVLYTDSVPIHRVQELRRDYGNNFLWFQRNGGIYVIRDRAFLSRVEELFAPKRALEPEHRAISREESELDLRIDAIEDRDDGTRLDAATEAHLREMKARMREVSRRERELDRREEQLEREEERVLWRMLDDAIRNGTAERDVRVIRNR